MLESQNEQKDTQKSNSEIASENSDTSQDEVLNLIDELNSDNAIHGILVQSPPPAHIDEEEALAGIETEEYKEIIIIPFVAKSKTKTKREI